MRANMVKPVSNKSHERNPSIRFGEGEIAAAKPWRTTLLCTSKDLASLCLAVLVAIVCFGARGDTLPPTSLYVQNGLIGHLDAIDNGGVGVHETEPSTWTDLTGNHTFTLANGAAFTDDAWKANASRYISATSSNALAALKSKTFTLEMVISHPSSPVNEYEYWAYFGNASSNHRYLTMEIRTPNSSNPVVGGLQYRAKSYAPAAAIAEGTGLTAWGMRHYLAVVCSGNTATLYCDGTNILHQITSNAQAPSLETLTIGASTTGSNPLNTGAEICALRMTERALSKAEILRNHFLDRVRFMGASATDGDLGYRVENGAIQVLTHVGGLGVQFSTDGGSTWQDNALDVWTAPGASVTFTARLTADGSSNVFFDSIPAGATVSGTTVTYTADTPTWIVARTPTSPSTSFYVQDGLIGHLDAIENGGPGAHITSPSTWKDLTGYHTFTCRNGATFSNDAWVGNASSYVNSISSRALCALKNQAFTLEMVIMHPATPLNQYEKWATFGNDNNRGLMVDIRTNNSKNPVIQGLQYRAGSTYNKACALNKGTKTAWGMRQAFTVICDGTKATLYGDGTNVIHTSSYGTTAPALTAVAFGAYDSGSSPLNIGAEICAVRMTKRVLSEEERMRNRFLDGVRFLGESATDGARGYRISGGELQVVVSATGTGVQFSVDGGTTWQDNAITSWWPLGTTASLAYRVQNGTTAERVLFAELPDGVKDIGGRLAFTPLAPTTLTARVAHRPATSFYIQDGLIGHLDAIENGGVGVHADSPATWTDLTSNHTFTCNSSSAFSESAWVGNGSRYITTTSEKSLAALKNQAFTLEMTIAHPDSPIGTWEFWSFFGDNSHRQLTTEIRIGNSKNPLIGGNQYRTNGYSTSCEIPDGKGKTTTWNKRHYLVVTCVGTNATLYYDGTNALHVSNYGTIEPTLSAVTFGANGNHSDNVLEGAEICSVRMTERVLTGDEIMRNRFLDAARFNAELPDDSCGYRLRESDGALLVHVTAPAVEYAQYSLDGETWTATLDDWVVADAETTARVRSTDYHYGPSWSSQILTPAAPLTLSVEMAELPPRGTIISVR